MGWVIGLHCSLLGAIVHCVSKNDTDVALHNFDADQPILIIFARDVAERVCYQMLICYPPFPGFPNYCLCITVPGKTWTPDIVSSLFSHAMAYNLSLKQNG